MHQQGLSKHNVLLIATVHRLHYCPADTLKWRDEAKIDECLETFLPDDKDNKLRRFLPSGFVGLDKTVSIHSIVCPGQPVLSSHPTWQQNMFLLLTAKVDTTQRHACLLLVFTLLHCLCTYCLPLVLMFHLLHIVLWIHA